MDRMSGLTKFLLALVIVGAINWGLIGFFNWDLVAAIFGGPTWGEYSLLSRIVYALVGLAGLALAFMLPRLREVRREVTPTARRAEIRP